MQSAVPCLDDHVYKFRVTIRLPETVADVETAVRDALSANQPLEIVGHGTKRAIGHRSSTNAVLDLSKLNRITLYEPEELVLTVQAGAAVAEVQALLATSGQAFAFEPMNTSALFGTTAGSGTIGGMIGAGLAGPRRIKAGGVRDHLLGLAAVSGFGDSFKAGGRVVKNVTGYDLCKLAPGSFGTLAVMTEVTLKVMPKAEAETTLILSGLDLVPAGQAMIAAITSPFDVSAVAHLPRTALRPALAELPVDLSDRAASRTLIRLEGIASSVAHRAGTLGALLARYGTAVPLGGELSARLWAAVRDIAPLASAGPLGRWPVWRIVCPSKSGAGLAAELVAATGGEVILDWGGGLLWLAVPPAQDAFLGAVRTLAAAAEGHATLLRQSDDLPDTVAVFPPLAPPLAALNGRIKAAFDPQAIFNRGRMGPTP